MKAVDKWDSLLAYHLERVHRESNRMLPFLLVKAQMIQESGGYSMARSPAGACGLFQLMPATATWWKVKNIYDPDENTRGAMDYMNYLLGNVEKEIPDSYPMVQYRAALASYNGGWGYVRQVIRDLHDLGAKVISWEEIVAGLRGVIYAGKRPDQKQMVTYAEKITTMEV